MVRVKICGITNLEDARGALLAGADALGFVFAKSPRQVSVKTVREIRRVLGPWTPMIGVFVNEKLSVVRKTARVCGLTAVQLHGDETPGYARRLRGMPAIKAFHVDERFDERSLKAYEVSAYLFDARLGDKRGGTGQVFNWQLIRNLKVEIPVIISGGLNPQNVSAAVRFFKPYAVDVSTGVERAPGKKDLKLMKRFVDNAKKK